MDSDDSDLPPEFRHGDGPNINPETRFTRQQSTRRENSFNNNINLTPKAIVFYIIGILILVRTSIYLEKGEQEAGDALEILGSLENNLKFVDNQFLNEISKQSSKNQRFEFDSLTKNVPLQINGKLSIDQSPADPLFGNPDAQQLKCLKLVRKVAMYQWDETEHRDRDEDGNEHVSYSYNKRWVDYYVNSNLFHGWNSGIYHNPEFQYPSSQAFVAKGAAIRNQDFVDFITENSSINPVFSDRSPNIYLSQIFTDQIDWKASNLPNGYDNYLYYVREDISKPVENTGFFEKMKIGDYRIYYTCYGGESDLITTVGSIMDVLELNTSSTSSSIWQLQEYIYQNNLPDVAVVFKNSLSKTRILNKLSRNLNHTLWTNRFLLLIFTFTGFFCLAEIVQFIFRKIPNIGNSMASGINVITGLISFTFVCFIISFAWIDNYPIFSVMGFILVLLPWIGIYLKSMRYQKRQQLIRLKRKETAGYQRLESREKSD